MTKNKVLLVFFALVFGFCSFADCETDRAYALLQIEQAYSNNLAISQNSDYITANLSKASLISHPSEMSPYLSNAQSASYSISNDSLTLNSYLGGLESFVRSIDCSTNCVDLSPIVTVLQHINTVLGYVRSDVQSIKSASQHLEIFVNDGFNRLNGTQFEIISSLSNLNYSVTINANSISNQLSSFRNYLSSIDSYLSDIWFYQDTIVNTLSDFESSVTSLLFSLSSYLQNIDFYVTQYLPYLETISDDLKLIFTNGTYNIDQSYTNQLYYSSLLGFDRFRYYAQGQSNNVQPSLYPLSPYDELQHLRNATIYDAISSGFASLLISQGSINNYLYWLKAIAGSNRLEAVESHLVSVSNLVGRLDDYVLGDFSNEVSRLVETLSYVTNRVDYTTNLVYLAELVETNNTFLSSIDSKLDVLDYIKILSTTPLSEYSGDQDYFDYLTNLYINGSADSGGVSTNWFERMEILLASLVFVDSDGTNDIPQGVEMEGFDTQTFENALTDYTFTEDFTSAVGNIETTSQNFMQILNGYHSAIKSVSLPASVSIGIGGLDGEDTHDFKDMMHGHFQVSFNVGASDRFTVIVRAVTTMCWVLLTLIFIWHCGFWICSKIQFFYRLMRLLINSIWLRS